MCKNIKNIAPLIYFLINVEIQSSNLHELDMLLVYANVC